MISGNVRRHSDHELQCEIPHDFQDMECLLLLLLIIANLDIRVGNIRTCKHRNDDKIVHAN